MNMRLDVVVRDTVGLTGTKIITSFINERRNLENSSPNTGIIIVENPKSRLLKPYNIMVREDYYFALNQEWENLSTSSKNKKIK